jgi:low temperature requirement protein LtrA
MGDVSERAPARRAHGIHDWEPLRRVTWLELFFDLVFVVAVARLGALLHDDHSARGVAAFAGLVVAVWWLWNSFSYFADLFDDDGPIHRGVQLVAALGAAVLAVTLTDGFDRHSARFAAVYAVLLGLLTAMYAVEGRAEPRAAELCRWFVAGYATGAGLWAVSLLVPTPGRYAVWGVALVANATICGPIAYARMREPPHQISHMPERFGLFTIVVLGEAVWSTVNGMALSGWNAAAVTIAVAGYVIAAGMWWVYFGGFDEAAINRMLARGRGAQMRGFLYGYGHPLIYAAIVATGIGVELAAEAAVHHEAVRLPLFGVAQASLILGFILVSAGVGLTGDFDRGTRAMLLSIKVALGGGALALSLLVPAPTFVVAAVAVGWVALVSAEIVSARRGRAAPPAAAES